MLLPILATASCPRAHRHHVRGAAGIPSHISTFHFPWWSYFPRAHVAISTSASGGTSAPRHTRSSMVVGGGAPLGNWNCGLCKYLCASVTGDTCTTVRGGHVPTGSRGNAHQCDKTRGSVNGTLADKKCDKNTRWKPVAVTTVFW